MERQKVYMLCVLATLMCGQGTRVGLTSASLDVADVATTNVATTNRSDVAVVAKQKTRSSNTCDIARNVCATWNAYASQIVSDEKTQELLPVLAKLDVAPLKMSTAKKVGMATVGVAGFALAIAAAYAIGNSDFGSIFTHLGMVNSTSFLGQYLDFMAKANAIGAAVEAVGFVTLAGVGAMATVPAFSNALKIATQSSDALTKDHKLLLDILGNGCVVDGVVYAGPGRCPADKMPLCFKSGSMFGGHVCGHMMSQSCRPLTPEQKAIAPEGVCKLGASGKCEPLDSEAEKWKGKRADPRSVCPVWPAKDVNDKVQCRQCAKSWQSFNAYALSRFAKASLTKLEAHRQDFDDVATAVYNGLASFPEMQDAPLDDEISLGDEFANLDEGYLKTLSSRTWQLRNGEAVDGVDPGIAAERRVRSTLTHESPCFEVPKVRKMPGIHMTKLALLYGCKLEAGFFDDAASFWGPGSCPATVACNMFKDTNAGCSGATARPWRPDEFKVHAYEQVMRLSAEAFKSVNEVRKGGFMPLMVFESIPEKLSNIFDDAIKFAGFNSGCERLKGKSNKKGKSVVHLIVEWKDAKAWVLKSLSLLDPSLHKAAVTSRLFTADSLKQMERAAKSCKLYDDKFKAMMEKLTSQI